VGAIQKLGPIANTDQSYPFFFTRQRRLLNSYIFQANAGIVAQSKVLELRQFDFRQEQSRSANKVQFEVHFQEF
jgi:hypothetical protein